jgi:hypothetical protein
MALPAVGSSSVRLFVPSRNPPPRLDFTVEGNR